MTTAFAAASAVAAIPAGWLGKKFGRKKTILGGLAIFIIAFGAYLLTRYFTSTHSAERSSG